MGGEEGARIRLGGGGSDGMLASLDVGADGATVVRRLDGIGIVKVNGVALGAEPAPLLHGDRIDVAGRELFFGDDRRAGNTQYVQPVRLPESASPAVAGKPTAATGGRVISLVDGREYPIPLDGLVFGRDPSCDVVLGSTEVSRKHASLSPSPEGYLLRDMSTNGVLVNGESAASPSLLGRGAVLGSGDGGCRVCAGSPNRPRPVGGRLGTAGGLGPGWREGARVGGGA